MTKEEIQLLLSGVALVFTPFLSALVVRHQLKIGHYWWTKQQEFLNVKTNNDRKYKIFEDCARLIPALNKMLLDQQVFLFSKNECEYLLKLCTKPELVDREYINKEHERYKNLIIEINNLLREKISEVLQVAYIAKRYYDDSVFRDLICIYKKIKKAETQIMPLDEMSQIMNDYLKQGATLDAARIEKDRIFDQRWGQLDITNDMVPLLDRMYAQNQGELVSVSKPWWKLWA